MDKKIVIAVIIVVMVLLGMITKNVENKNLKKKELEQIATLEQYSVKYSEPGEDSDYNYIINPEIFINTNLGVDSLIGLNDDVNELFSEQGVTGSRLRIENISKTKSVTSFEIIAEETPNTIIKATYDEKTAELSLFIEK